jgi:hypothetical protein
VVREQDCRRAVQSRKGGGAVFQATPPGSSCRSANQGLDHMDAAVMLASQRPASPEQCAKAYGAVQGRRCSPPPHSHIQSSLTVVQLASTSRKTKLRRGPQLGNGNNPRHELYHPSSSSIPQPFPVDRGSQTLSRGVMGRFESKAEIATFEPPSPCLRRLGRSSR